MLLDDKQCYRALQGRDPRFDGRFFTGVKTTGIYCRPICPARTPKPQNVVFFSCAAAAEAEGFRPCRRCRPETAPGTPEWIGPSAVVSRALRWIALGRLDEGTVEELAQDLELGPRQLTRLFQEHLGTSPGAIAQTRRVQFARQLIDETSLSMTEVASSAGFTSVRRFNSAIRQAFAQTPTELRRSSRKEAPSDKIRLSLSYRSPLDFERILEFLRVRAIPGVECVTDRAYQRTITVGGRVGSLEVACASSELLALEVCGLDAVDLLAVVERVRDVFDLNADPWVIGSLLGEDARLAACVKEHAGVRVPGAWDGFELAVRAILGQQVSVRGATTLSGRLVERFGVPLESSAGALTHLFPEPEVLASADLSKLGMPSARGKAINALARAVASEGLELSPVADEVVVREQLLALPGVGPWTADYIAMRALKQPDAFPVGDLGLRKALATDGDVPSSRQLARESEHWRPWRAYAAMLLWQSLGSGG